MQNEEQYVGIEDFSKHFNINHQTTRKLISNNEVPYIKIGNQYKLKISEAEKAFKQKSNIVEENIILG